MTVPLDALYRAVADYEDAGEEFERIVRRVYEAVLQPGDAAVDVGAHVGKHTLPLALACGAEGSVLAVEPIPWAYDQLVRRVRGAGFERSVRTVSGCCGEAQRELTFSVVPGHPGWSSLAPRAGVVEVEEITVQQTTLDDECLDGPRVRFVKVDVEGAEVLVLQGAQALLERDRPVVHVEVVPEALEAFGASPAELGAALRSHGYLLFDLLGHDVSDEASWLASTGAEGVFDYLAVHPDDPALGTVRQVLGTAFEQDRTRLTALRGELVLGAEPSWRHEGSGVTADAAEPAAVQLPVTIGPWYPVEGRAVQLQVDLDGLVPHGTQTVLELRGETGATALVRYVDGSDLQVLWIDPAGGTLAGSRSAGGTATDVVEVELADAGGRLSLTARSGEVVVGAAVDRGAVGSLVGTVGARRHHPNPEHVHVQEAVVSASAHPAPGSTSTPTAAHLPLALGGLRLERGTSPVVRIEVDRLAPGGTQTVLELHWAEPGVSAVTRLSPTGQLQVLWVADDGPVLASSSSPAGEQLGPVIEVQVGGTPDRPSLSARSGDARADAALPRPLPAGATATGTVGARHHHSNPERLQASEALVSTSTRPSAGAARNALLRARRVLGARS
ncbi:MAG TPA: FkbM family methyltransferase [Mycobacteriales bacterium]|nr:FkbM family methyltransferase [Mycobacteriales bacterium]